VTKWRFSPRARAANGGTTGEVRLEAGEYRLLRDLVSERLGIWFGPESRTSLERRLRERLVVHGLSSYGDYYQLLKYGPSSSSEWDEASEILTTHETYFFREDYQLRAFRDEVLPRIAESRTRGQQKLHVWSAGCSTGEEAYTIAILILESGLFQGWDVRVYGSDVSKRCIAAARRGVYGPTSFRAIPKDTHERWFSAAPGPRTPAYVVSSQVRALCHFGQMNLLDEERTHLVGRTDVIFCRNVILYFDAAARRRVIDMFYERLLPGGVLLLGHAESLLNVSTAFELLHLKEDLVYRKPLAALGAPAR
jgi:chemotaxis protein methyltransferase CheR